MNQQQPPAANQSVKEATEKIEGYHIGKDMKEPVMDKHAGNYTPGLFKEDLSRRP